MFIGLVLGGIFAWFMSTLAGGGSSLILMPIIALFLGSIAIPSVITISALFGNIERAIIYRHKINWDVVRWELPGALLGAFLGAFMLSKINPEWLTLLIALFLFLSGIHSLIKKESKSLKVYSWSFLPLGFCSAFSSGIIGSTLPFLTPFYLNYGLKKDELLGTQAINRTVINLIKVIAYTIFGVLKLPYLGYGLMIGLASLLGNWLGYIVLQKINEQSFRNCIVSFVLITSFLIFWQQRNLLIFW
jgi:uncharacterized membrane protein YfcA